MIQFNLLPDVKLQFIRARRTKRLMTLVSIVVIAASLTVFTIALFSVKVVQKKSLSDLNKDISKYSASLKGTKDLDKILTVQNQLNTLSGLHASKPVATRMFTYLTQITPATATISKLNVDFVANTITVVGDAPDLNVVNTYTDTLKATTYKVAGSSVKDVHAFTGVVLSSFGRDDKKATYTITANFDPLIFNSAGEVTLVVPQGATVDPAALFQKQGSAS